MENIQNSNADINAQPPRAQDPRTALTQPVARLDAVRTLNPNGGFPERYLTKPQVAEMFQISTRSVDDWMKKRLLPFAKIGRTVRFRASDIDACIREKMLNARSAGRGI
jgi:excisionase family DNA binding protein